MSGGVGRRASRTPPSVDRIDQFGAVVLAAPEWTVQTSKVDFAWTDA